jgi:hypothetical protein
VTTLPQDLDVLLTKYPVDREVALRCVTRYCLTRKLYLPFIAISLHASRPHYVTRVSISTIVTHHLYISLPLLQLTWLNITNMTIDMCWMTEHSFCDARLVHYRVCSDPKIFPS